MKTVMLRMTLFKVAELTSWGFTSRPPSFDVPLQLSVVQFC
jgi:hypothetical protein